MVLIQQLVEFRVQYKTNFKVYGMYRKMYAH